MQPSDIAELLKAVSLEHQSRSKKAHLAIEDSRWPAAACELRHAAAAARVWAEKAVELADRCDAEAESGRAGSEVPPTLIEITEPGTLAEQCGAPTLESLEAGLLALAHHLGREHAVHTRRAMVNVQCAQKAVTQ